MLYNVTYFKWGDHITHLAISRKISDSSLLADLELASCQCFLLVIVWKLTHISHLQVGNP